MTTSFNWRPGDPVREVLAAKRIKDPWAFPTFGEGGSAGAGGDDARQTAAGKAASSPLAKRRWQPAHMDLPWMMGNLNDERPECMAAMSTVRTAVLKAFHTAAPKVADQVRKALAGMEKATPPRRRVPIRPLTDTELEQLIAELDLDLSAFDIAIFDIDAALYDVAFDAAFRIGVGAVGVRDADRLTNRMDKRARDFAKERSAELVGKRVNPDGEVVDNPDPKFSILQTTRDRVRSVIAGGLGANLSIDQIAKVIEEVHENGAYPFTEERADLIARTEVSLANEQGKLQSWREIEEWTDKIEMPLRFLKQWVVAPDEKVCAICQANADQAPIEIGAVFQSGDESPPGHPNCRCVLVAFNADEGK